MKVGDIVKWSSQSHGVTKEKQGKIVAVVPAMQQPTGYFDTLVFQGVGTVGASASKPGMYRFQDSYIVAVQMGKTQKSKPRLYWPRVEYLTPVVVT